METWNGIPAIPAKNSAEWRKWLEKNHAKADNVWLILYNKDSGRESITYREAVDEALCFGWIDSKPNKRDAHSRYQFFSKRNPKSKWSGINKEKIKQLVAEGRMAPAGLEMVELAKKTGTWDALNEVEKLVIPGSLHEAFKRHKNSAENFEAFPKSVKRMLLEWILNAKTDATRQKRLEEIASKAAQNIRANQYVRK